jgi:predicted GTPase
MLANASKEIQASTTTDPARRERVLIMGAAGRDFHTFNVCFRDNPEYEVVAFTAAQIPGIEERRYPPSLGGALYPDGIPIYAEDKLEELIQSLHVQQVILAYSDLSHVSAMHIASRVFASGADFRLIGPRTKFSLCCTFSDFGMRRSNRLRQRLGGA